MSWLDTNQNSTITTERPKHSTTFKTGPYLLMNYYYIYGYLLTQVAQGQTLLILPIVYIVGRLSLPNNEQKYLTEK